MTSMNVTGKSDMGSAQTLAKGPRPSDKWIPWYFVAFFVGLAVVNVIFIYIATSTHSGVVTENAYSEGLNYNETIAAAEAQKNLGWSSDIFVEGQDIKLQISDGDTGLRGASVVAWFTNPTRSDADFSVILQQTDIGLYEAKIPEGVLGQWDIRMQIEWQQIQYQTNKRIVIAA